MKPVTPVTIAAIIIFAFVAAMHVIRYFSGWEVTVNGTVIPLWVSILGALVPAVMACLLLCEAKKKS